MRRVDEPFDQPVAHGERERRVPLDVGREFGETAEPVEQVVDDRLREAWGSVPIVTLVSTLITARIVGYRQRDARRG
jgi:hypothetical protein